MKVEFTEIGWGRQKDITERLLKLVVIRDDTKASMGFCPYYLATTTRLSRAVTEYQENGGTVTAAWRVADFLKE